MERKGLPHLSDAVEEHLHLHHVFFIPLPELNIWGEKKNKTTNTTQLTGKTTAR